MARDGPDFEYGTLFHHLTTIRRLRIEVSQNRRDPNLLTVTDHAKLLLFLQV